MATPYDTNNTGGTLPLPRIHIPTWFTINSVSEYNDALLDLDLLEFITITNSVVDLGGSHIESYPYLVVNDTAYSEGNYLTTNSNGNYLTIPISDIHVSYDKTGFSYTILLDKPYDHTYTFPWSKIENFPSLLVSTVRLAKEIWPKILQDIIPANTFSSEEEALIFANNNWPSSDDFWDIITNETDLVKEEIESLGMDPVLTIPITVESGSKDTVVIGDTVPELGSIIAYSHPTEFFPDTNSSHVLYFKNAELKSFNFAVQNNTVIDRIEKLYRYTGPKTNPTTKFKFEDEDPDVDPKNMIINEGTANVPANTEILMLTEGSVVTSV